MPNKFKKLASEKALNKPGLLMDLLRTAIVKPLIQIFQSKNSAKKAS